MSGEAGVAAAVVLGTATVTAAQPGWVTWAAPHLPVAVGLMLGSLALAGVALDQGAPIKPRKIFGHVLMLGVLGLIAETGNDFLHLAATARMLAGAGMAMLGVKAVVQFRLFTQSQFEHRLPIEQAVITTAPENSA